MNKQQKAFTLVELIVVVTILAILSTIGFVSYSSYLTGVRDTNRISNMKALSDGLELYSTKFSLPLPEGKVDIKANGILIAYQGYAGANVLESIEFSNGGKDPKNDLYYSYYLTKDKKYFQLMGFLEEEENLQTNNNLKIPLSNFPPKGERIAANITKQTSAVDYSILYPTLYGKKLGILTGTGDYLNIPIQELESIQTTWILDITNTVVPYNSNFKDSVFASGTGAVLYRLEEVASVGGKFCSSSGGLITISATGAIVEVTTPTATYCGDGITQNPNNNGDAEECDDSGETATCSASCLTITPAGVQTFIKQTPTGETSEENISDGDINLTSGDLEFFYDTTHDRTQIVGLRFTDVDIAKNANISSAKIKFKVDNTGDLYTDMIFQLENNVNPAGFSADHYDLSNRTLSTTEVNWTDVPGWDVTGVDHYSPDLSIIVQEMINNTSWVSGNSIVFIISGTGTRVSHPDPTLEIEYTVD